MDSATEKNAAVKNYNTTDVESPNTLDNLTGLIEHSPMQIYLADPDTFNFIAASESARKNLGCPIEQLHNLTLMSLLPEQTIHSLKKIAQNLQKKQKNGHIFTCICRKSDSSTYPARLNIHMGYFEGKPLLVAVVIDLSLHAEVENESELSVSRLKPILRTIPNAIFTVDLEKKITSWNIYAEKLTGLKTQEVIGKKCTEIWHCPACLEKCKLLAEDIQKPLYGREYGLAVKSKKLVLLKNLDLLRDKDGNVIGGIEVCSDITDQKQMAQELSRSYASQQILNNLLSMSLQNIPLNDILQRFINEVTSISWLSIEPKGAIFIVEDDPKMLVMKAGRQMPPELIRACKEVPFGKCICGKTARSAKTIFTNCVDHKHEINYPAMEQHSHCCVPIISSYKKVQGLLCLYLKAAMPLDDKEKEFLTAVADVLAGIVERKRFEEKILYANEQLKAHDKFTSDFVVTISHELRTPLTIFKSIISNAMENLYGKISPELRKNLQTADETINRLTRIISDFLDFSRIESGALELRPVKIVVQSVVDEAVNTMKPLAAVKGLMVTISMPDENLFINAERERIIQVLTNLISNSVRFVPEIGGHISITVKDLEDEICIEVQDNGRGIEPNDIEKVFNRFVQIQKQAGPGSHGSGLGLSISKQLIEMQGGRIWAESTPGEKTVFALALPKYSTSPLTRETDDSSVGWILKSSSLSTADLHKEDN